MSHRGYLTPGPVCRARPRGASAESIGAACSGIPLKFDEVPVVPWAAAVNQQEHVMVPRPKRIAEPEITLAFTDHARLTRLAESHASRVPEVADALMSELERARVVPDGRLSAEVVRMGSTLRFTSDLGEDRQVTLVFPRDADISAGRISILTPIGAALIGLSKGQSIDWTARDGRVHRLTVRSVQAPDRVKEIASQLRPVS